jgi:hypothetical protein
MIKTKLTVIAILAIATNLLPIKTVNAQTQPIPEITTYPQQGIGWKNTTTSGAAEIGLARHLTNIGAKMYGAWWCPHCHEQKLLFGKTAFTKVKYIECDSKAKNSQPQLCSQKGIKGYPSWEIKGKLYPGVRTLEQLTELSGYQGNQGFKYYFR